MRSVRSLWLLPFTLALALPLFSQDDQGQNAPPVRTARISFLSGSVTVDGNGQSFAVQLNMPAVAGQRIATGDDGQAEIEFEDGSVVRLTPNSSISLNALDLDNSNHMSTQLQPLTGLLYFETRASGTSTYFVDAAGEQVAPRENSVFRIGMDALPAEISVLQGSVSVSRQGGFSAVLKGGETLRGDEADNTRYFLSQGVPEQTWDHWNEDRDQDALNEANLRTEARDTLEGTQGYGWSDLDAYGNWYDLPGEGRVWQPTGADASGFDPYGNGSWVSYPTGYVWASSYPWGWTPFRCGNWNYWNGFGWGWQAAGCNTFGAGWGYGGYGSAGLRIRRSPPGYRLPIRPVTGPRPRPGEQFHPRPIVSVRNGIASNSERVQGNGRTAIFNGHAVTPLRRQPGYTQRGGSAVGAGLRRDFPVDPATQRPSMGIPPTQPNAVIVPGAGWTTVGGRSVTGAQNAPATATRPANGVPQPASGTSRPNWNGPSNTMRGHQPNPTAPATDTAPTTRPNLNGLQNHHQQAPGSQETPVPQQVRNPTGQSHPPAGNVAPTVQPQPAAPVRSAPVIPTQTRPAFQPTPTQQPRPAPVQQPQFHPTWTPPPAYHPAPAPPPPAPRAAPAPATAAPHK